MIIMGIKIEVSAIEFLKFRILVIRDIYQVYVHALVCDIIEAFKSHHLSFYEVFFCILEYSLNFQDE